jgi:hypothetical protein
MFYPKEEISFSLKKFSMPTLQTFRFVSSPVTTKSFGAGNGILGGC